MKKANLLIYFLFALVWAGKAQVSNPVTTYKASTDTEVLSPIPASSQLSRWSLGVNAGLPFFWGDMTSMTDGKTYIGYLIGIQSTYQATPWLGVTLSLDYARNKAGARDYAAGYLLGADGMTYYTPVTGIDTQPYSNLYSTIEMYSAGLHADVNVNHFFGKRIANSRLKLILSPAVYGLHFGSKVYTKNDDQAFVSRSLSKDISLGLGGDVALRYNLTPSVDLQLKGTGIWITDNNFDNVSTVGYVKQNAMWGLSAGIIWKINHIKQ